jgi:hypothetical protein
MIGGWEMTIEGMDLIVTPNQAAMQKKIDKASGDLTRKVLEAEQELLLNNLSDQVLRKLKKLINKELYDRGVK